jgi:hypothetical protein
MSFRCWTFHFQSAVATWSCIEFHNKYLEANLDTTKKIFFFLRKGRVNSATKMQGSHDVFVIREN